MWNRKDNDESRQSFNPPAAAAPTPSFQARPQDTVRGDEKMSTIVNIGQSIFISGELSGNEDLTVEGRVEGRIDLREHNLVIGPKAKIQAEVHAKTVTVNGEVIGNIRGGDLVEVRASGTVRGDISSPRIIIADGARFKGSVDMERANEPSVVRKDANKMNSPVEPARPTPVGQPA